jgi:hypothetical protein
MEADGHRCDDSCLGPELRVHLHRKNELIDSSAFDRVHTYGLEDMLVSRKSEVVQGPHSLDLRFILHVKRLVVNERTIN